MKSILQLSHTKARQFFLKQESYCSIELPKYFTFQVLLNNLSGAVKSGLSNKQLDNAKYNDGVNYTFYHNKDGKFAWRPLQIINPVIYVYLVHKITTQNNWNYIVDRFKKFQQNNLQIKCCSIPVISEDKKKSDKASSVNNWWHQIELQSLELALNYDYLLNTDITDCYGSIYTHTITWALHDKNIAKEVSRKKEPKPSIFVGNDIDTIIRSMQYAQTNGIPQGSVLMDFIAEMVLGYADMLLSDKIEEAQIKDYQILRYKDDYRIFTNNQENANIIAKLLTEVLIGLNLRLNSHKTFLSQNLIKDSIKSDKRYWMGVKQYAKTLQKTLLLIHGLAEQYSNSGSLKHALSDFQNILYNFEKEEIEKENIKVLISIVVDIAYKNPKIYPVAIAILSKLMSFFKNDDIIKMVSLIETKFNKIPNVGHLQIWLQQLTLKIEATKDYEEKLCKKVLDNSIQIWNVDWLNNDEVKKIITDTPIIDTLYIDNMEQIIKPEEVQLFKDQSL